MALPRTTLIKITYDGKPKESAQQQSAAQSAKQAGTGGGYVVKKGDTLWAIAKKYLGSGKQYPVIYEANKDIIESTAKAHGKKSSDGGHWIWAGETFVIPGTASNESNNNSAVENVVFDNTLGEKIQSALSGVDYTDASSGQSDSITLSLNDVKREWLGELMPVRGADLGVEIVTSDFTLNCGKFVLDDISFSGRPTNCSIGGVSVPQNDNFKSLENTVTYEKTTVQEIASKIAQNAGVTLVYDAGNFAVEEIEQTNQTDSAFLSSLCEKYGLSMKVYNHKIVIYDAVVYEAKPSVLTLTEKELSNWSYKTTIEGTYTGAILKYSDPDKDEPIVVTMGVPGRMYSMHTSADNEFDAKIQAAAKVNEANRNIETMDITLAKATQLVATQCIDISGLEKIDGKYFIDSINHSIGSRGYVMQLSLHKVQVPVRAIEPVTQASGNGGSYTVVKGDSLWRIAKKFYNDGSKYTVIYNANKDLIESTAKKHGKSSSSNGQWIWAGEVLTIPEVSK